MRLVQKIVLIFTLSSLVSLSSCAFSSRVVAIESTPTVEPKMASPLLLTEFQTSENTIRYIQLYNNSKDIQYIADWSIEILHQDTNTYSYPYQFPEGYLLPGKYVVMSVPGAVTGDAIEPLIEAQPFTKTDSYYLVDSYERYEPEPVPIATSEQNVRHHRFLSSAGNYTTTRKFHAVNNQQPLYADKLGHKQDIREEFPLAPVEVLVNPRRCNPVNIDATCQDYIKFYNTTLDEVDFSGIRLRIGYVGQDLTANNTIALSGIVKPNEAVIFTTTANNEPLNLTNSGAFIWLEDEYGTHVYKNTVIEYPSASSKEGLSWAVDENGVWQWTTPQPGGKNSFITEEVQQPAACAEGYYRHPETGRCRKIEQRSPTVECGVGQYRNPETGRCKKKEVIASEKACAADEYRHKETGRCRKIQATTSTVSSCKPGYYRHPETGRCRKIVTAGSMKISTTPCRSDQYRNPVTGRCNTIKKTSTATLCKEGEYRNPATGRCKKIAIAAAVKPCAPGQERNPATNRCRKIKKDTANPGFRAEVVEASTDTVASWWALGGVGSLAIGYAGWEWRSEMARWLRRAKEAFLSNR